MAGYAVREYAGAHKGCHINRVPLYIQEDEMRDKRVLTFLKAYANTDVYYTIYTYYGEDKDKCPILAPLYLDFDDDDVEGHYFEERSDVYRAVQLLSKWFKVPVEQVMLYFSGSKGFHVIIPHEVFGWAPSADLNTKLKCVMTQIQKELGTGRIDGRIYDRKRLFRIPNSINGKSGLYKIPLTLDELMKISSYEELKQIASKPKLAMFPVPVYSKESQEAFEEWIQAHQEQKHARRHTGTIKIPEGGRQLLPCVEAILREGVGEGSRNNTAVAVASSILQSGKTLEETENILYEWNERNDPPLEGHELHAVLMSAYRMFESERFYGCSTFKDLGLCLGGDCILNRSERNNIAKGNIRWQKKSSRRPKQKRKTRTPWRLETLHRAP